MGIEKVYIGKKPYSGLMVLLRNPVMAMHKQSRTVLEKRQITGIIDRNGSRKKGIIIGLVVITIISSIGYLIIITTPSCEKTSSSNTRNGEGKGSIIITFMISDNTDMTPIGGAIITISNNPINSYLDIISDTTAINNKTNQDGICQCEIDEEFLNKSYNNVAHFLVRANDYTIDYRSFQRISQSMSVNFSLSPMGIIKGRIKDNDTSLPIKDVCIFAYHTDYEFSSQKPLPDMMRINVSKSNIEGDYIFNIPVGRYNIITNGFGYYIDYRKNISIEKFKSTNVSFNLCSNNNSSTIKGIIVSTAWKDGLNKYKPQIIAYDENKKIAGCVSPMENGNYSLSLEKGTYFLIIRAIGHQIYYYWDVFVRDNKILTIDFILTIIP